jgi:antitoxin component of MazEF toxin-antitoxin module
MKVAKWGNSLAARLAAIVVEAQGSGKATTSI